MKRRPLTPDRSRIDLSDASVARSWSKQFGKPVDAIAAAVAKVGNNAQTVKKELDSA